MLFVTFFILTVVEMVRGLKNEEKKIQRYIFGFGHVGFVSIHVFFNIITTIFRMRHVLGKQNKTSKN